MDLSQIFSNPRAAEHQAVADGVGATVVEAKNNILSILRGTGKTASAAAGTTAGAAPAAAEAVVGSAQALQVIAGLAPEERHLTLVNTNNLIDQALVSTDTVDSALLQRALRSGAADDVVTSSAVEAFVRTHLGAEVAAGRMAAEAAPQAAPEVQNAFVRAMQAAAQHA